MADLKKVALFSKEYPPTIYGGAGVHVEYLSRALARLIKVEVRAFGDQRIDTGPLTVKGYEQWDETGRNTDPRLVGAVDAMSRSLMMAKDRLDADLVHCHTWLHRYGGLDREASCGALPYRADHFIRSSRCGPGRWSSWAMPII